MADLQSTPDCEKRRENAGFSDDLTQKLTQQLVTLVSIWAILPDQVRDAILIIATLWVSPSGSNGNAVRGSGPRDSPK
jgi:hypothetical protein